MTIPKLFLYKAQNANIVGILRRGTNRNEWELIKWDLDTDIFTEGQWLLKKHMNGKYAAISPNGKYFGFHYEVFSPTWDSFGIISKLPNFTALYVNSCFGGCWNSVQFEEDNSVVGKREEWLRRGEEELQFVRGDIRIAASGLIEIKEWIDPKGRKITTQEGRLFADSIVLYDTTDHKFTERKPI